MNESINHSINLTANYMSLHLSNLVLTIYCSSLLMFVLIGNAEIVKLPKMPKDRILANGQVSGCNGLIKF